MPISRFFTRNVLLPLALTLSLSACTPTVAPPPTVASPPTGGAVHPATPVPETLTPATLAATPTQPGVTTAMAANLNSFSLKLYGEVAKEQKGNLAVSPLGSFILLQMLYEGSTGPAHDEMASVLGLSPTSLAEVGALVTELDALPSLALAQKIYLDKKAKLVEAYLQRVGPMLAEPVQVLPFADDPPAAVRIINDWVALRTKGLIKNFLSPLPPLTVSVLVSVLHFQGKWLYQFPKDATAPADFTLSDGNKLKVSMMRLQTKGITLFTVAGGRGVILPYTDDTEMVLTLPDAGTSADGLWSSVIAADYPGVKTTGALPVVVELPRFKFEVPTFQMTEHWKGAGLEQTVSNPDLTPMLVLEPPSPLELMVFHKTFIKVDEEGTEAAAATAVAITRKGGSVEPPPETIRFDRPFGFLLRHSKTGAILMLGRVERPDEAIEKR
jgi:serpin B